MMWSTSVDGRPQPGTWHTGSSRSTRRRNARHTDPSIFAWLLRHLSHRLRGRPTAPERAVKDAPRTTQTVTSRPGKKHWGEKYFRGAGSKPLAVSRWLPTPGVVVAVVVAQVGQVTSVDTWQPYRRPVVTV